MGSRPDQRRKRGGILNGVDGVITAYRWTDEFAGQPFVPGITAKGKDAFHSLFAEVSIRQDGAEGDVKQYFFAGCYDDFEVSADELTLSAPDGGTCNINDNTAWTKFIDTLIAGGFPVDNLSDDPTTVNYESIIGTRAHFIQVRDAEATKRRGQRTDPKTGKKYDRTTTAVETVLEVPEADAPAPVAAKAAPKASTAKKGNGKAPAVDPAVMADTLAAQAIVEIVMRLGGKPQPITALTMESLKTSVLKDAAAKPYVSAARKQMLNADFVGGLADNDTLVALEGVDYQVTYNPAKKLVGVVEA